MNPRNVDTLTLRMLIKPSDNTEVRVMHSLKRQDDGMLRHPGTSLVIAGTSLSSINSHYIYKFQLLMSQSVTQIHHISSFTHYRHIIITKESRTSNVV